MSEAKYETGRGEVVAGWSAYMSLLSSSRVLEEH